MRIQKGYEILKTEQIVFVLKKTGEYMTLKSSFSRCPKVNRSMMYAEMEYGGTLGEFCFLKLTIPKDRQIQIDGARLYVFNNSFLYVDLPLFRKILVPEDVHYIYLGSLQYNFTGNFFEINSISKLDEFDIAAVELAKQYGPDARLYRANLSQIEESAKK